MADAGSDGEGDDAIPPAITAEELDKIPDAGIRHKVEYLVQGRFEMIRSPLLPPEILARYGEVVPGLPEKLVRWTEEETAHRRSLEKSAFEERRSVRARGQLFGFCVAIIGVVSAALLAAYTNSTAGTTAASIIAIVSVGGPFAARLLAARFGKGEGAESER